MDGSHGILELRQWKRVGKHGVQRIAVADQKSFRPVPGVPDQAAGHAIDLQPLEEHVVRQINCHRLRRNAQQHHLTGVGGQAQRLPESIRMAGHFQADCWMRSQSVDEVVPEGWRGCFKRGVGAQRLGQAAPILGDVAGDNGVGAHGVRDGNCHQSHRTAAVNGDRLSRDVVAHGGVHGVPQRLEQDGPLDGDFGAHFPGDTRGHADVLGKPAIDVDAKNAQVLADVGVARPARTTDAVENVTLDRHDFTLGEASDGCPQRRDLAHDFVSKREGRREIQLRPGVPGIEMPVRTADAGAANA